MDKLKPQSKGHPDVDLRYDPQSKTMTFDNVFKDVAPGIAASGSLAHKWGPSSDHTVLSVPPSGLKGE